MTPDQKRVYAARRMSLAVDRVIVRRDPVRAAKWVTAWARAAGLRTGVG